MNTIQQKARRTNDKVLQHIQGAHYEIERFLECGLTKAERRVATAILMKILDLGYLVEGTDNDAKWYRLVMDNLNTDDWNNRNK